MGQMFFSHIDCSLQWTFKYCILINFSTWWEENLPNRVICSIQLFKYSGTRGGGGGHFHIDVAGTCRWTGYDFPVITIDTGYLNRPNWLLASYSVYHRVASQTGSQPTMFMSGPRSRHQRRNRFLWMHDDTQPNRESVRTSTNEPWINARSRNSAPGTLSLSQGMHMKVFSKVYCDRVYFLCAERFVTGSGFHPPAARTVTRQYGSAPPPPPRSGTLL